jgi:AcrR family transcriptional regulator
VTRTRLDRTAYFIAAFNILAESGHDGLTIAALCNHLGVTKGSFYHHFIDISDFVDALLVFWTTEHQTGLSLLGEEVPNTDQRLDELKGVAMALPHGAEAAIRAWSWSNESVAKVQKQVDTDRMEHLARTAENAGLSGERARLLAKITMSVMVGMQQLDRPTDPKEIAEVFSQVRSWIFQSDWVS